MNIMNFRRIYYWISLRKLKNTVRFQKLDYDHRVNYNIYKSSVIYDRNSNTFIEYLNLSIKQDIQKIKRYI